MIKKVDEIPQSINERRRSYREKIRTDIQYAIDHNILKFEFDGDYNWNRLAEYAREEALIIMDQMAQKRVDELGLLNHCEKRLRINHYYIPRALRDGELRYIRIVSRKEGNRNHVYCEIFPEAIDKIVYWFELEDKKIAERRKQ